MNIYFTIFCTNALDKEIRGILDIDHAAPIYAAHADAAPIYRRRMHMYTLNKKKREVMKEDIVLVLFQICLVEYLTWNKIIISFVVRR